MIIGHGIATHYEYVNYEPQLTIGLVFSYDKAVDHHFMTTHHSIPLYVQAGGTDVIVRTKTTIYIDGNSISCLNKSWAINS